MLSSCHKREISPIALRFMYHGTKSMADKKYPEPITTTSMEILEA